MTRRSSRESYAIGDKLVLEDGPPLAAPVVTRRADIVVSGVSLGYIEVSASFEGTLYQAGLAAHLSLLLGFGMYFALRTFPLRVLDRTLGALKDAQRELAERNEVLRINGAQLANALKMARAGHWEYDVATDQFTFNDIFYEIFHTTAEAVGGYVMSSAEYARRFVHPDSMSVVGDEVKAAMETADPKYSREFEHRMVYGDGKPGYITVRIFIVKDEHGRTIKTYGVNQDITERKRVELELAESKSRLDSALTNMSQGLCMFDADERLVVFNLRVAELYGLPPEEVLPGMTTRQLMELAFATSRLEDTDVAGTLALQKNVFRERSDGSFIQHLSDDRSIAISYRPMPDGGVVATFEDITRAAYHRGEDQAPGALRCSHELAEPGGVL